MCYGLDLVSQTYHQVSHHLSCPFSKNGDVISKRFDEVDIRGKITIKGKLREIAYPDMT